MFPKGNPGDVFEEIIRDNKSSNILFFIEEEGEVIDYEIGRASCRERV